jgi:Arc/MetJ family transcription regulator
MNQRTNLVIDIELLKEAKKILGAETNSATVNEALEEVIRMAKIKSLTNLFGSGIWSGDLAQMREDRKKSGRSKRRA